MALLPACRERSATPMGLFKHWTGVWRDCGGIWIRHQNQRTKALPGASRGQMGCLFGRQWQNVPENQTPVGSNPPCLWVQLQNGNKTSALFYGASKAFGDYLYLHLMVFNAVRVLWSPLPKSECRAGLTPHLEGRWSLSDPNRVLSHFVHLD